MPCRKCGGSLTASDVCGRCGPQNRAKPKYQGQDQHKPEPKRPEAEKAGQFSLF